MYLFSRRAHLSGSPRSMMAWATDITDHVRSVTGRDISLWAGGPGYPVGTFVWSTRLEGRADMYEMTDQLLADDGYLDRAEAGQQFLDGPSEDMLRQVVRAPSRDAELAVGSVVMSTTAMMRPGHYTDALAWSSEMAGLVEEISGHGAMFCVDAYGDSGRVTWLVGCPDAAALDAGTLAVETNDDYVKRVGEVDQYFLAGTGSRGMARRIA